MTEKKEDRMKGLRIHVMQYSEVKDMSISERVKKILNLVLGNKIVIFHGRLRAEEEARLIEDTMELDEETKRELEESRKEIREGKFSTHEEIKKKYGL